MLLRMMIYFGSGRSRLALESILSLNALRLTGCRSLNNRILASRIIGWSWTSNFGMRICVRTGINVMLWR